MCALATLPPTPAAAQPAVAEAPPALAQRPAVADPSSVYSASAGERWVEDADFVYGPRLAGFDLTAYFNRTAPHLSPYAEYISHWCGYYSISPQVLLSVMEMRSGMVSSASPRVDDPFVGLVPGTTLQQQVLNALAALSQDFYAYRSAMPAPDATSINAGTYALLKLFRGDATPEAFATSAAPVRTEFHDTLARLFPDAARSGQDAPGIAAVPPVNLMQFPWKNGVSRRFGGVHVSSGVDPGIMSSLDFYRSGTSWGSDTSTDYVVAAHAGVVTKFSSCGVRVTSSSGWQTNYYHLDGVIVATGQLVAADQTIGIYANNLAQATCTGGSASGPHVHFSLLKDGIYNSLDGVTINGYLVHPGRFSYDNDPAYMWLEKNGVKYFTTQALVSTPSPMPNLTINDVSVTEGDAGTKTATFTVSLSPSAIGQATVNYATAQVTAGSGDYVPASGILTFPDGTSSLPLAITINGDTTVEASETFNVTLSNASNAVITDSTGVGTIQNDDHTSFTDALLTAGINAIKLVHLTELRTAIDVARANRGVPAFAWTDPVLTAGLSMMRAVHVMELRSALDQVYTAAGVTPPSYTDPSLTGVTIKSAHITELRNALLAVE